MGKSKSAGKVFGTILSIILTAVSLYYIYLGYDFVKSVAINVKRSGFSFYSRFPSVLWGGILEYILGTGIIIALAVKQSAYAFRGPKNAGLMPAVLTSAFLTLMAASEILSFKSFTTLLGRGYSMLSHLQSYLNVSGVIRVVIFLFFIFYLIVSIKKFRKADEI
jgi:hypothetical protein